MQRCWNNSQVSQSTLSNWPAVLGRYDSRHLSRCPQGADYIPQSARPCLGQGHPMLRALTRWCRPVSCSGGTSPFGNRHSSNGSSQSSAVTLLHRRLPWLCKSNAGSSDWHCITHMKALLTPRVRHTGWRRFCRTLASLARQFHLPTLARIQYGLCGVVPIPRNGLLLDPSAIAADDLASRSSR